MQAPAQGIKNPLPDDGGLGAALTLGEALLGSEWLTAAGIAAVPVLGPRRWWGGMLDVEGLALGSTRLAAASLAALLGRPGRISTSSARIAAAFDSFSRLRIIDARHPQGRAPQGFAPLSRFWATADGWLRTHANYPHHRAALLRALGVNEIDPLEAGQRQVDRTAAALRRLTSAEAERHILAAGGVAAALRSVIDWRASGAGVQAAAQVRGHGPLEVLSPLEWGADVPGPLWRAHADPGLAPLAGLRVVELTRVIAGPTATRTLAALGADVTRIDPPRLPELVEAHLDTDQDKTVVSLDLRGGDARLHQLLASAHVIVTGYRHLSLARFGLDQETLARQHPHLVCASLSAWGPGPWQERRGFDSLVQAGTGIASVYRGADGKPGALPVQALDHATGQLLVAGIAARLRERALHGVGGGSVRAALAWTAESLLRLPVPDAARLGELEAVRTLPSTRVTGPGARGVKVLAVPCSLDVDGVPAVAARWRR